MKMNFFLTMAAVIAASTAYGNLEIPKIDNSPGINSASAEQWAAVKEEKGSCSYLSCYDDNMLYLVLDVEQPGSIWAGEGRGLAFFNDRLEINIERNKEIGNLQIYADAAAKLYVLEGPCTVPAGEIKLYSRYNTNKGYRMLLQIPWNRINPGTPKPHAVTLKMTKVRVTQAFYGYEIHKFEETFIPGQRNISTPVTLQLPNPHERVINFGRPGHNAPLVLDMLSTVLDCQPDLAIVMVGTNDVVWRLRWITTEEYERFLRMICDRLVKAKCQAILITIPPCLEEFVAEREKCTPEETSELMPRIKAINEVIFKVGKEYSFPVADFNALFIGDHRSKESILRNLANTGTRDGVHPTEEGYRQLAVLLKDIIDRHKMPTRRIACIGDSITYGVAVKGDGTNTGDTYPGQLLKLLNAQDQQ